MRLRTGAPNVHVYKGDTHCVHRQYRQAKPYVYVLYADEYNG